MPVQRFENFTGVLLLKRRGHAVVFDLELQGALVFRRNEIVGVPDDHDRKGRKLVLHTLASIEECPLHQPTVLVDTVLAVCEWKKLRLVKKELCRQEIGIEEDEVRKEACIVR